MDLWSRLEDVHARWNVLEHPFSERWTTGRLSRDDLARYAGQYRYAVVAIAQAADRAAGARRQRGARGARGGGGRARRAVGSVRRCRGQRRPQPAEPETEACAAAWAGEGRDLLGHLVALYAIESAQPAISRAKADGLREHYGFASGPATAYFDLHGERDREHAAEGRELIVERLESADEDALVAEAERVLKANWALLDGVERLCGG